MQSLHQRGMNDQTSCDAFDSEMAGRHTKIIKHANIIEWMLHCSNYYEPIDLECNRRRLRNIHIYELKRAVIWVA